MLDQYITIYILTYVCLHILVSSEQLHPGMYMMSGLALDKFLGGHNIFAATFCKINIDNVVNCDPLNFAQEVFHDLKG